MNQISGLIDMFKAKQHLAYLHHLGNPHLSEEENWFWACEYLESTLVESYLWLR